VVGLTRDPTDTHELATRHVTANGLANETDRDGRDDVGHRRRSARLCLVSEMRRDVGDARRSARNPEVEGSNPSPATKARGPLSNRKRAFCASFVNRLCNVALGQAVSLARA